MLSQVAAKITFRQIILIQQSRRFSSEMGRVTYFNRKKGYGFVQRDTPEKGPPNAFVHFSDINSTTEYKTLNLHDRISFDTRQGIHGVQAINISVVPRGSQTAPSTTNSSTLPTFTTTATTSEATNMANNVVQPKVTVADAV